MSKPFDATLKTLLEESPVDWPALAGHPEQTVEVIDADISTFTGATDKVLRVRGLPDWITHFEFQSGPDATCPGDYTVIMPFWSSAMIFWSARLSCCCGARPIWPM